MIALQLPSMFGVASLTLSASMRFHYFRLPFFLHPFPLAPPFHSQLRCTTLGLCAEDVGGRGARATGRYTHKKLYLEAERRSSSAGWRRDGAEQKRARAFIDFQKDVTKFLHRGCVHTCCFNPCDFDNIHDFSAWRSNFILRSSLSCTLHPNIF